MKTIATTLLAAALALAAPALAQDAEPTREARQAESIAPLEYVLLSRLEGELAIDAAGNVTDFSIATPIADDVRAGVDRVVRTWRFEPKLVDGVAVPVRSKVRIVLGAPPVNVVTKLWVDSVTFHTELDTTYEQPTVTFKTTSRSRPSYPPGVGLAGVKGRVLVALHLGLDGRVQDASVVQSALLDVNGRKSVLEAALKQFETASLRAARRFRFDVAVRDGATPTADDLTVHVPFGFFLGATSVPKPAEWRLFVRSPMQRPAWLPADARLAVGVEDVADGELRGGRRGPRLLTPIGPGALAPLQDVAGTTL